MTGFTCLPDNLGFYTIQLQLSAVEKHSEKELRSDLESSGKLASLHNQLYRRHDGINSTQVVFAQFWDRIGAETALHRLRRKYLNVGPAPKVDIVPDVLGRYHLQYVNREGGRNLNELRDTFLPLGGEMEVKNIDANRQQTVRLAFASRSAMVTTYRDHVDDTRLSVARACQRNTDPDPVGGGALVNFGLDRDLLDCYTVMFYNGREGRGLVPLDRVREDFGWFGPVLAVTGGATVGSVLKDFCFVR